MQFLSNGIFLQRWILSIRNTSTKDQWKFFSFFICSKKKKTSSINLSIRTKKYSNHWKRWFSKKNTFSSFFFIGKEFDKIFSFSIFLSFYFYLDTKWKQHGITVAGGNGQGKQFNQLDRPFAISTDDDQTLFISDCGNDRIVEWKLNATNGRLVADGNGRGNQTNQLNRPTDVILDHEKHSLIIADLGNRRVMQWSRQTHTEHGEILLSDIDCWG